MPAQKRPEQGVSAAMIIGLIALAALAVAVVVLGLETLRLVPLTQAEMRATPTPTPLYGAVSVVTRDPSLPTSGPVLQSGHSGDEVKTLQARLADLGYYTGVVDGQYGPGTREAVRLFQAENGLSTDGAAGTETLSVLYSASAKPLTRTPTPAPTASPTPTQAASGLLKSGSSGEAVRTLQNRLAVLGYYSGDSDGQYGPATKAAVTTFQRQNGLEADGAAGTLTQRLLYSDQAKAYTPPPTPDPNQPRQYITADGMPLVVNKQKPLPEDYQTYDLVVMNDYLDSSIVKMKYDNTQAEREAADALLVMLKAAVADGVENWQVSAAYRDVAYQQRLLDRQINTYMTENGLSRSSARTAALKLVAEPGASEHHLGTCFDITVPGTSFKGTKQHKWLTENCWDYGFILRYAEGKEAITGYTAEAWHYRYVGVEHAQRMHDEDLCLEEYVAKYGAQ